MTDATDLVALIADTLEVDEAWLVGGVLRDELADRPVLDVDVACDEPAAVARAFAVVGAGAPFPLSTRHGAWRVVVADGRTVDFTPLGENIEANLGARDFTINAMARRVGTGDVVDPFGGRADFAARTIRAVTPGVFAADPVRLLRLVRLEDELGFRSEPETERWAREHAHLATAPAGERLLDELGLLSVVGFLRLDDLGLLAALGGSTVRADRATLVDAADFRLVAFLGDAVLRLPVSRRLARYARTLLAAVPPPDGSPRAVHRFRRATEPWAVDAAAFAGAFDVVPAIVEARSREPAQPLLRGDELGLPPGPLIGELLAEIAEERAAGVVSTREEALELVRRKTR
jgi:hypothetical protein